MKKQREKLEVNRIAELLIIKNMKRVDLAKLIDISEPHLSKIINNKTKCISLPIASKIAIGLNESIEDIFIFKI